MGPKIGMHFPNQIRNGNYEISQKKKKKNSDFHIHRKPISNYHINKMPNELIDETKTMMTFVI